MKYKKLKSIDEVAGQFWFGYEKEFYYGRDKDDPYATYRNWNLEPNSPEAKELSHQLECKELWMGWLKEIILNVLDEDAWLRLELWEEERLSKLFSIIFTSGSYEGTQYADALHSSQKFREYWQNIKIKNAKSATEQTKDMIERLEFFKKCKNSTTIITNLNMETYTEEIKRILTELDYLAQNAAEAVFKGTCDAEQQKEILESLKELDLEFRTQLYKISGENNYLIDFGII